MATRRPLATSHEELVAGFAAMDERLAGLERRQDEALEAIKAMMEKLDKALADTASVRSEIDGVKRAARYLRWGLIAVIGGMGWLVDHAASVTAWMRGHG